MNLNLISTLKRLLNVTDTNNEDICSADDTAGAGASTSEATTSEEGRNAFINVFTEDILPEILDNLEILSRKDLLNFRQVNRCWRDAATSVLLKRNVCQINLNFGEVALDEDGSAVGRIILKKNNFGHILPSCKYFNAFRPRCFLSDLSQLISTSPKFPSTSIRFHPGCWWGFGSIWPTNVRAKQQHQVDLMDFLSLYGKRIKKLSLMTKISKMSAENLLFVYMPHLICIDLTNFQSQWFSIINDQTQWADVIEITGCRLEVPNSQRGNSKSSLKLTEIFIGYDLKGSKINFVRALLNVSPSLSAIQMVDLSALKVLLKLGKTHLIQDLRFNPNPDQLEIIKEFAKLLTNNAENGSQSPQLTKLVVMFRDIETFETCNNTYYTKQFSNAAGKVLNSILSTSQDSLEYLGLYKCTSKCCDDLFIPPLPHLKSLQLVDYKSSKTTRFSFLEVIMGRALQAGEEIANELVDNFDALTLQIRNRSNTPPANYFPSLRNVSLSMLEGSNNSEELIGFFSLKNLGTEPEPEGRTCIPADTHLTVTKLKLFECPLYDNHISTLFPNVSHLKIHCGSSIPQNWVWTAFPKLERFEISTTIDVWDTLMVDSFFTGISQSLCAVLRSHLFASSKFVESDLAEIFKRHQPYIGDCENLKEFKIKFRQKLKSKFASTLTAAHGFQEVVHRTKIVLSFESLEMNSKEIEETRRNLDNVAACTEIRM